MFRVSCSKVKEPAQPPSAGDVCVFERESDLVIQEGEGGRERAPAQPSVVLLEKLRVEGGDPQPSTHNPESTDLNPTPSTLHPTPSTLMRTCAAPAAGSQQPSAPASLAAHLPFQVSGFGFRVSGHGSRVSSFEFRVSHCSNPASAIEPCRGRGQGRAAETASCYCVYRASAALEETDWNNQREHRSLHVQKDVLHIQIDVLLSHRASYCAPCGKTSRKSPAIRSKQNIRNRIPPLQGALPTPRAWCGVKTSCAGFRV